MPNSYSDYKENYIDGGRKFKLVSFMKDKLPDLTDTLEDKDIYKLAQDYFPQYDYEEWDKSNIVESLNDVCDIERELVKREYNLND